ncbi:Met-10+ like-protein-domain-containing protein [Microdochium trichocladiopsis]|uniref:tRNA (guanine(37)-N1)-methyltransferase n=1 Tax=Microdochium trichocladiopsis TaxID=1682393 RepID=A0A9P9BWR6_9PEZI|nr:Met-10+ like-protein-domain-containing protein [Microdochium trichocladiopsis]KAH7035356.1 Met-10+ like-protein-domain-containing protein [Microdochium trichocladiopsis]
MLAFRPPVVRSAAGVLDRALFSKTVRLAAAAVEDKTKIAKWRRTLEKANEMLVVDRLQAIRPHPDPAMAAKGSKCLLLDTAIKHDNPETWGPCLKEAVSQQEVGVVPFDLTLQYDYWSYEDVMSSLIPPEAIDVHDGIPVGFNTAGHVAHLNLRDAYLPYKKLIAEVLVDKNPNIRTVINKTADVGNESEFRTFSYEILAGDPDLNVEVRENECTFRFDYSKVYWNSKLHREHTRLIDMFQPGEVVCDIMAGIGPFAVPAGKKGVFVWANDYNPESFNCLEDAIKRNKVSQYVRPFNRDGKVFVTEAADSVFAAFQNGESALHEPSRKDKRDRRRDLANAANPSVTPPAPRPEPKSTPIPATISHFVMNLPASAISFLPSYRGLYVGKEELFEPHTSTKLPMVHVHCFAPKQVDSDAPLWDVCERISTELGVQIQPGDPEVPGRAAIHNVRTVAPNKDMFCASFRLLPEVAFASRS